MDACEQLQLLEYLVADIGRKVGWQVIVNHIRVKKDRVENARRFSIKLFESPDPKISRRNVSAFAGIHPRLTTQ